MNLVEFARIFGCSVPDVLKGLRRDENDFWRWWWTQFASEQAGIQHQNLQRSLSVFRRILEGVDVAPFLQEIDAKPENWLASTGRNNIGVQQHTDSVLLRRASFRSVPGANNVQTMMDIQETRTGELADDYPKLMGFLERFSDAVGKGTLSRAMIVR